MEGKGIRREGKEWEGSGKKGKGKGKEGKEKRKGEKGEGREKRERDAPLTQIPGSVPGSWYLQESLDPLTTRTIHYFLFTYLCYAYVMNKYCLLACTLQPGVSIECRFGYNVQTPQIPNFQTDYDRPYIPA